MPTLLQLCTEAIEGIDSFSAPSTIIGNSDPTAVLLKNVATQVGRELVREARWQALKAPYTFATVANTSAYGLPSDFQRFANLTFWNTSEGQPLIGPLNAVDWASVTRGLVVLGVRYAFAIYGNFLRITPTPTAAQNIGFDYYSRFFCTTDAGVAIENWSADSDLWRLDPDLAVRGIQYRFRARKGLPYAEEKADYLSGIAALQFDDTPKPLIDVSGIRRGGFAPSFAFYGVASADGGSGSGGGGGGGSVWILADGTWSDVGVWDDTASWID